MVFIGWVLATYIGSFTSVEAVEKAMKSCNLSACIPTDGPEYFDANLPFYDNLSSNMVKEKVLTLGTCLIYNLLNHMQVGKFSDSEHKNL